MGRKKRGDMSPKKIRVSYTIDPRLIDKMALIATQHNQKMSAVFEEAVETFVNLVEKQEEVKPKSLLRRPNVESSIPHEIPAL